MMCLMLWFLAHKKDESIEQINKSCVSMNMSKFTKKIFI